MNQSSDNDGGAEQQPDIEQLHELLSNVSLATGLQALSACSVWLWTQQKSIVYVRGEAYSEWQTAFIAQELLRVGADHGSAELSDASVFHTAMHLANSLRDYFQINEPNTPQEGYEQLQSFVLRTAGQQFPYQSTRSPLLPRYLSMLTVILPSIGLPGDPDLEGEFQSTHSMSILDYIQIGFYVFAKVTTTGNGGFLMSALKGTNFPNLANVLNPQNIKSFLNTASLSVERFQSRLTEQGPPPRGMERHKLNILLSYPIVENAEVFWVPSIWSLLLRITSGLMFEFLIPRLGNKNSIKTLNSLYGRLFQKHVGAELGWYFDSSELLCDPSYKVGKNGWQGPDWTLVEGKNAVLFECKVSRMTKVMREFGDVRSIRDKLKEDIVPTIKRLPLKTDHIRAGLLAGQGWPQLEDFEYVIVTLDPWWPEAVAKEIIATELQGTIAENLRYHLMWVEDLERLGAFRKSTSIFDLLRRRWNAPPVDTRSYLNQEASRLGIQAYSERLEEITDEFLTQMRPT